ncbi:PREDICTED: pentatricopeptide repeat-containing protein At1g71420 [Theobroma cacao]|uniref:Pentatricopeptide repeat-containing protein At1g71420 n=1 Tax=Theobroma cacao TaxID=3641 RepID=A0AB32URL7_THECC|nr:PREDICTED: pentatricopeptide repeat-containing protein At1g71420 [Theobroma cacao]
MSCPSTRACFISFRSLSSSNLLPASNAPNNLLNKVRLLASRGQLQEALSLFYNTPPELHSRQTYASLFHECAHHGYLQQGLHLHHFMLAYFPNNTSDLFVANHLINMYSKCGYLSYAQQLFDAMRERNVVSWTALVSGYAQRGRGLECFRLFLGMLVECRPNEFAVTSVLSSCDCFRGKQVHALASKMGLDASVYVANALITMYSKSYKIEEAWTLFKSMHYWSLVSWNSMIAGFQLAKLGMQGIGVFAKMHDVGIGFDRATLLSVFSSLCGSSGIDVDLGLKFCFQLFCLSVKTGFISEVEVATAFMKAYSDLGGDVSEFYQLFLETTCGQDIVFWTSMITTFAEHDPVEAFFLYRRLLREDLTPDWYTFSIVLKASAGFVTEHQASAIHSQVIKAGFEDETVLKNALIHAYARCGSVALSKQVFEEMGCRDLVSWNSMLKAYGLHGKAKEALQLFPQMDVKPDTATFVALLSACSHSGLVEEGIRIFDSMFKNHGIIPQLDHYACMVDILGRAGRIIEAEELISRMPMEPDSVVWSALLGSCRKHGETRLAKIAAAKLKKMEPKNSLGYVQMSNIYSSGGSFNEAGTIRKEMNGSGVKKEPGLSWIEVGNQVHEFASGGRHHPQREAICTRLEGLIGRLKEIGYVPEISLALQDIEEEHKQEQLFHHSEKMALVFAIMNEGNLHCRGSVIRIMKNIRICVDCHNFMKLASDLLQKEIIVRDSNRFHHFKNKVCSCNDYW